MRKPLTLATALALRTCIAAGSIWLAVESIGIGLVYRELHIAAHPVPQARGHDMAPREPGELGHASAAPPPVSLLQQSISASVPRIAQTGAGLLAMLLAIFLSLRCHLHLPLRALTEGLRRMAAGDREYRLAVHGLHELAALAHAGNLLAEQHARQRESMREAFADQARELESDCNTARSASAGKSEQLMVLGHELRAPLNGITGALELLHREQDAASRQQLLTSASQSARHLQGLAERLLDLSCLEAGRTRLHPAPAPLLQLIDETVLSIIPAARSKKLELSVLVRADPGLDVSVDALRLRQILLNLLGNAIKFTPCGSVALEASHEGGLLMLTVTDSGPGIPEAMRERIFEPFIRADHDLPGTGLGLAISRQLVAMMGGVITAENREPAGARFRVELPLPATVRHGPRPSPRRAPAALRAQLRAWGLDVAEAPDRATEREATGSASGQDQGAMEGAMKAVTTQADDGNALAHPELAVLPGRLWQALLAEAPDPVRHQGMPSDCPWILEILLVDDMATNRLIVGNMLKLLGHRVATASSAGQALRQGRGRVFDLVIFDLGMKQVSGLQAARAWRAPESRVLDPDCRIAALTGSARDEDRAEAIAAGMHDYLVKPATMDQLAALVNDACEHQMTRGVELTPRAEVRRPLLDISCPGLAKRLALELGASARALRSAIRRHDLKASRRLLHALQGCAGQAGLVEAEHAITRLDHMLGSHRDMDQACCANLLNRIDECIVQVANGAPAPA